MKLWIGNTPPDNTWQQDDAVLSLARGGRSRFPHQSFDQVSFVETGLTDHPGWAVYLDEMLRLLKPEGRLEILLKDTNFASIFEVMRRIYLLSDQKSELVNKVKCGDYFKIGIDIGPSERRNPSARNLDIIVISSGENFDRLNRFINSVKQQVKHDVDIYIHIDIPKGSLRHDVLKSQNIYVYYSDYDPSDINLRKMQRLNENCFSENVLILHDRYSLTSNFIDAFSRIGGDFNVIICKQVLEGGDRFPDLVSVGSQVRSSRASIVSYDDWSPFVYVNGGAILAKRQIFLKVPLNPMLGWGEREDVEWTARLRAVGIEPRFVPDLVLCSEKPRDGYLEGFERTRSARTFYRLPGGPEDAVGRHLPKLESGCFSSRDLRSEERRASRGLAISEEWQDSSAGLCLRANVRGYISARIDMPADTLGTKVKLEFLEASKEVSFYPSTNCLLKRNNNGVEIEVNATNTAAADYFSLAIESRHDLVLSFVSVAPISKHLFRQFHTGLLARLRRQ